MIIFFCVFCLIVFASTRLYIGGIDENYLSKDYTMAIKGIFIVFVFMSHIKGYADFSGRGDWIPLSVISYLGQLMVTMFLFYSGYGILESVKRKDNYIKLLPKNRLGKTFFDFALAIFIFLLVDVIIGQKYSFTTILLAFSGWTSVGNSNWYMFAIFTLYILTYICFRIFYKSNFKAILLMTVLSLAYIYVMSKLKENWWSDTYLCYVAGMWYSYFKEKIDLFFKKYQTVGWGIAAFAVIIIYLYISQFRYIRLMTYNISSVLFCLVIVILSMKISFKSRILIWAGKNLFWLYILQRIPMILLKNLGINEWNAQIYLWLCFGVTVVLAVCVNRFSNYLKGLTWWKKR